MAEVRFNDLSRLLTTYAKGSPRDRLLAEFKIEDGGYELNIGDAPSDLAIARVNAVALLKKLNLNPKDLINATEKNLTELANVAKQRVSSLLEKVDLAQLAYGKGAIDAIAFEQGVAPETIKALLSEEIARNFSWPTTSTWTAAEHQIATWGRENLDMLLIAQAKVNGAVDMLSQPHLMAVIHAHDFLDTKFEASVLEDVVELAYLNLAAKGFTEGKEYLVRHALGGKISAQLEHLGQIRRASYLVAAFKNGSSISANALEELDVLREGRYIDAASAEQGMREAYLVLKWRTLNAVGGADGLARTAASLKYIEEKHPAIAEEYRRVRDDRSRFQ